MKKESSDLGILERNLAKVTNQKKIRELVLDILRVADISPTTDAESVVAVRRIAAMKTRKVEGQ
jgi:hypothetical protein